MLLDTSGLLACLDASEARHGKAVSFYDSRAIRLTHNYVLAELIALAQARRLPRESVIRFVAQLAVDRDVEMGGPSPASSGNRVAPRAAR